MGIFTVIIIVLFAKNTRVKKSSKEVFNSTLLHIDLNFFCSFVCFLVLLTGPSYSSSSSTYFLGRKKTFQWTYFLYSLVFCTDAADAMLLPCVFCVSCCIFGVFCSALSATIVEPIRNIY